VIVLDNLSTGRRELVRGGRFIQADLRSLQEVSNVFGHHQVEAVMHFAALMQVGESYADPQKYYLHNLISSLYLLQAMLEAGVKYFIFSSSAAVYGQPVEIPIREDHPLQPTNPYGASKFMVERVLPDYDRAYGLKYISLRYFNAAGADPTGSWANRMTPRPSDSLSPASSLGPNPVSRYSDTTSPLPTAQRSGIIST